MNIRVVISSLLLSTVALFTSCMEEDRSVCNPGLDLRFVYTLNQYGTDKFKDEVEAVTAFVFDQNDLYLETYSVNRKDLKGGNILHLPLDRGEYSVVVYGGSLKGYVVGEVSADDGIFSEGIEKGVTRVENLLIKVEGDPTVTPQPKREFTSLYHGIVRKVTIVADVNATKKDIPLTKNTNKIKFNIKGLEYYTGTTGRATNDAVELWCEGSNGRYKFDNSIGDSAPKLIYHTTQRATDDKIEVVDFHALRLLRTSPVSIVMWDKTTNTEIKRINIVNKILQIPGFSSELDMDKCDEYIIDLNINKDLSVNVTINGWEIIEIGQ